MHVNLDEQQWSELVAEDMLWHLENSVNPKVRKAAEQMASYYMTYEQNVQYFGPELAEEMWNDE